VALLAMLGGLLYLAVALGTEVVVLATEASRERRMRARRQSLTDKKLGGVGGSGRGSIATPLAVAGRGSIYEKADVARLAGGGGAGGPYETTLNPAALRAASTSRGGDDAELAALRAGGSFSVAETVSGMSAPPPPEVWRVIQAAFAALHAEAADAKLASAAAAAAAAGGQPSPFDDGARRQVGGGKQSFAPQSATVSGSEGSTSPLHSSHSLQSFRSGRSLSTGPRGR
jgi:hypothetical protein